MYIIIIRFFVNCEMLYMDWERNTFSVVFFIFWGCIVWGLEEYYSERSVNEETIVKYKASTFSHVTKYIFSR